MSKELKIVQIKIGELKPTEYNPRSWNERAIQKVRESIEEYGFVKPLVVNSAENRKNIVIGGHLRLKVAKDIGFKEVPINYVDIPDIKKEQKLNLLLNKTSELQDWDYDLLANFDEEILLGGGFSSEELDEIFGLEVEEDEVPEVPEKATTKLGEIFQLGNHRLMCGDATKKEDVEKLMNGEKADMVFTDPPYNISAVREKRSFGTSGKKAYSTSNPSFQDWIPLTSEFGKEAMSILIWEQGRVRKVFYN